MGFNGSYVPLAPWLTGSYHLRYSAPILTAQRLIAEGAIGATLSLHTARARPGRLSALSTFHSKSNLYGPSVWARRARRALNS